MGTIEKIHNGSYNGEIASVGNALFLASEKYDFKSDAYIVGVLDEMNKATKVLFAAINRSRVKSMLEEKDDDRKTAMRDIFFLTKGYLHYTDEVVCQAAHLVFNTFEKYGLKILQKNYALESSLIESLLGDLDTPELQSAIAKLAGLSKCITNLANTQVEFVETYVQYEQDKSEQKLIKNATSLRKTLFLIINNTLVVYLRAMQNAVPDVYGEYASVVAQIIKDNNTRVKNRNKK